MLREFVRAGKVFLLGGFFGGLINIFLNLYFRLVGTVVEGFWVTRVYFFPTNKILLFLKIFLNNIVVILLASVGPMLLVILLIWGRRNISLWKELNKSKIGRWLDRLVWSVVGFLKPGFSDIQGRVGRDIFVVVYGLPSVVMVVNGAFIGFLFTRSFLVGHLAGIFNFLKWVVPHGIIEVPTIITSAALGYSLGDSLLPFLYQGEVDGVKLKSRKNIKQDKTLKMVFLLIVLLLTLGAEKSPS